MTSSRQPSVYGLWSIVYGLFLCGCSGLNSQGLSALESVAGSQAQIGRYVAGEQKKFQRLLNDVRAKRLHQGMLKNEALARYGDPVIQEPVSSGGGKIFLYRDPVQYFNTDRVYLSFDGRGRLYEWEYLPAGDNG
jgi:hypothetical protein